MRPENLGIANGKITTGIPCNDLFRIEGIWAPPYVSSDFVFSGKLNGQPVSNKTFRWWPFYVDRSSGTEDSLTVTTSTVLNPEGRSLIYSILIKNPEHNDVPLNLEFTASGTLDRMMTDADWGFSAPHSSSPVVLIATGSHQVLLRQGGQSVVITSGKDIGWDSTGRCFRSQLRVRRNSETRIYFTISVGPTDEALKQSVKIADNPEAEIDKVKKTYGKRVEDLFNRLPAFNSDNHALTAFYNRSLVPLLMNRWNVEEFKLKPFYSTGSVRGGCIGDYLWNIGECQEILSLFDPEATKSHIRQFLETGVKHGFGFCPVAGAMLHPDYFYPINQEKVIGLTCNYVRNTGDIGILREKIGNGTILDSLVSQALFMDDLSRPVSLINYNDCDPQHKGGLSHLELRTPIGRLNYTNVMPDLNGRRYQSYILASQLSALAGVPRPDLIARAEELKDLLKKQLWDSGRKWFAFSIPDSVPPLTEYRYTIQLFYLFGSGALDQEEEDGLLSHLNDREFLSEYGMHSLAKHDPAYFQPDVDNGGPGSCTSFPLNIAKTLYLMGKPAEADDIMKRILWWGERMPYWGDSFYADTVRYREETPLQCTIDATAGAQCIIFGMFGIKPALDGTVMINPVLPSFAKEMSLRGVKIRGHVFDVIVKEDSYNVEYRGKTIKSLTGHAIVLGAGESLGS